MKILLIQPKAHKLIKGMGTRFKLPPWSLCAVAGVIPREHEVSIVDEMFEEINFDEKVDLVGITGTTSAIKRGYEVADEFRRRGIKVVMGGIHVSAVPEEALEHCDTVAVGEAELIWEDIVKDALKGNLNKTYTSDVFFDMKELPKPRLDLIKYPEKYTVYQYVQTTRGCPFNCEFCSATKFSGNKYRNRPIDEVIEEVKTLDRSKPIFFVDDHIGVNPKYTNELFEKLVPLKVKWASQTGVKTASREGFMELASKSGCIFLFIGFESINEDSLKQSNKNQNNPKEYRKIIKRAHDNKILIQGAFVIGLDQDKADVFKRLHKFIDKMKFDCIQFNIPYPYVGTQLRERLIKENRITSHDYDNYILDGVNFIPKGMTQEQLFQGYRWLYQKNSSIWTLFKRSFRKILQGQLFNSIFAFKINLGTRRGFKIMKKYSEKYNPIKYSEANTASNKVVV